MISRGRILVMEDEIIVGKDIAQTLRALDFQVAGPATTGEEAVRLAGEHAPDLLLADVVLRGDMDGIDAAVTIRQRYGIPVVFLTAFADRPTLERARRAEPLGYIIKPFDEQDLEATLEMAVYKAGLERQLHASLDRSERHAKEVQALLKGACMVLEYTDFTSSSRSIFDLCRELTGATSGYVALLSEDGAENDLVFLEPGGHPCAVDPGLPMPIRGLRAEAYRTGRVVWENDFGTSAWTEYLPENHMRLDNVLFAPLFRGNEVVGLMGLANNPGGFTDDDARITAAFGDLASLALDRSRTADALLRERDRSHAYLDLAGDIFLALDPAGHVTLINRKGREILGFPEAEINGKNWLREFVPETVRDGVRDLLEQLPDDEADTARYHEYVVLDRHGGERTIAWHTVVLRDEHGGEAGFLSSGRDMTERRLLEREAAKAGKLESIGVLAGGIAHDFNNILMAITGNLSLARMNLNNREKVAGMLSSAEKAAKRARSLTHQLLTFSRGGAPVKESVSLERVVRKTLSTTLCGSDIARDIVCPDGLWAVKIDPGQFSQAVANVLVNARQAMPEGGTLVVGLENVPDGSRCVPMLLARPYVRLSIADEGCGIPAEHQDLVFDPFFTTRTGASGLGLSAAYSIVSQHDGAIIIESGREGGTTVSIFVPADTDQAGFEKQKAQPMPSPVKGRVLLMDDEESVLEVAGGMLEYLGYEFVGAADGREAVERYRRAMEDGTPIAAVILDLTVPGGWGGKKAAEKLRSIDPEAKLIVSSGYSTNPVLSDYRNHGFAGALSKPYTADQLDRLLRELLAAG